VSQALYNLGYALIESGDPEARPLLERSLAIREKTIGKHMTPGLAEGCPSGPSPVQPADSSRTPRTRLRSACER
jgi:hypothetical protein